MMKLSLSAFLLSFSVTPGLIAAEQNHDKSLIERSLNDPSLNPANCMAAWLGYSDCALRYGTLVGRSCQIELHWALKCEQSVRLDQDIEETKH
jgi:hypothetical protein